MKIHFLGTGDAFCSGGRYQTCFLVELPDYVFLIDCGATSLMAMNNSGIDPGIIDSIIISHFHGDHFGGLPFMLLDANYKHKRKTPLNIIGPPGIGRRVGELLDIMYPMVTLDKLSFKVNFVEYHHSGVVTQGPLRIESYPVIHVPEALPHGLRISYQDKTLAFSGDTGWTDELFKISESADLFICECNFYDSHTPTHLNYQTIMDQRENLHCQRIILNHLGPEMLENQDRVALECSYDGLIINI